VRADTIDLQVDDDQSFLREAEYLTWVRVRIAQWRSESTSPSLWSAGGKHRAVSVGADSLANRLAGRALEGHTPTTPGGPGALAGVGISALYMLFLILFVVGISDVSHGIAPLAQVALAVALEATALAMGMVACAGLAWKRRYWSVVGRAHYTLVTLGALAFIWFLNYWNLLGFRW
jgi:hypothetical protein